MRKSRREGVGRNVKGIPLPLRYPCFFSRVIELRGMARDDMDNSTATHLSIYHLCLLLVSHIVLVSFLVSFLRLVAPSRSRYLSSCLLVSSHPSCYCVSSSSRLRLSSVPSSYSSPIISIVHLSARIAPSLPFPVALILPHIAVLRSSLPAAVLSISSSSFHPRTDGEIELMKTARPSYRRAARPSRHRPTPQ